MQNELISVLAEEVFLDIKSDLESAPFFAIILDTTQAVSKKDLLIEIFRCFKFDYPDDRTPSELKVVKAFTSFIEVEDLSANGLHKVTTNSIQQKELYIKNCREQGYDGAAVMNGKYSGLHNKIQNVAPHAYYVYCASHNLNLVFKDTTEAVAKTRQFTTPLSWYGIISVTVSLPKPTNLHGAGSVFCALSITVCKFASFQKIVFLVGLRRRESDYAKP